MWSLLSFLVVMPALGLVTHASTAQQQAQQNAAPSSSVDEDKMFVEDKDEVRTLWPEPSQDNGWPSKETRREFEQAPSSEHVRAQSS